MADYLVIARRFRPQTFKEVLGQDATVKTLKNAIQRQRLATAYLFCGSRGTGKTTLARVFAKALNCAHPTQDLEPCNNCPSCKEIANGNSLDVIEIDGASHRGIDDIRQINETVGYAASSGKYKIYIIDEVHMLTKEAFNALLKTLEEPPPKVKFFFATTEPHKVLPTILSRCQRFNLNRIPLDTITAKLGKIAQELGVDAENEALQLIAKRAEGGLRDAESLFDQMIAFHEGSLTADSVNEILGIMPRHILFELDKAGYRGDYGKVFEVTELLFNQGKDFVHFIEMLIEHIRTIMLIKLGTPLPPSLLIPDADKESYRAVSAYYTVDQCMTILDYLAPAVNEIRFAQMPRFSLEALLIKILRTHSRVSMDALVKRLAELEEKAAKFVANSEEAPAQPAAVLPPAPPPASAAPLPPPRDDVQVTAPKIEQSPPLQSREVEPPVQASSQSMPQHRYDTLLQFAAVELEGSVQLKKINRQPSPPK